MGFRRNLGGVIARKSYEIKAGDGVTALSVSHINSITRERGGTGRGYRVAHGALHAIAMEIADGTRIGVKVGKGFYPFAGAAETIAKIRKHDQFYAGAFVRFFMQILHKCRVAKKSDRRVYLSFKQINFLRDIASGRATFKRRTNLFLYKRRREGIELRRAAIGR